MDLGVVGITGAKYDNKDMKTTQEKKEDTIGMIEWLDTHQ